MDEWQRRRRAIDESDRHLVDGGGFDDRLAASDLQLPDEEPSHRDQRVTGADLQAVRDKCIAEGHDLGDCYDIDCPGPSAQVADEFTGHVTDGQPILMTHDEPGRVTISDPVQVRALPSLARTPSTRHVRLDHAETDEQIRRLTMHDLVDDLVDGLRESMAMATERANLLRARLSQVIAKHNAAVEHAHRLERIVRELRALMAVDDDGPEGSMGPSWILGQARQILGLHEESDAETLDLSGPGVEADEMGGES